MKYYLHLLIFFLISFCEVLFSQSSNQNYILTRTMRNETASEYMDKIDYFDGLGRPVQTALKGASPLKKDIVTLQEYDGVGREGNAWLPVPIGGTGAYVDAASLKSAANSFYSDGAAYANPVYEPSPLNRVLEQYGPGAAWRTAGRPVKTGYLANSASGVLSCGLYSTATATSLKRNGVYAAGELFVTQTTDENNNISYTFTDKLGQTILTRVMKGSEQNDTYFVYDDFGNLRYVLPPPAADALATVATWDDTNATLKNYAYIYKYDGRNRCTQKKLPGCEPVAMKYDKADRLIFSQDGNQKAKTEWTFFLYDVFGRQTVTGIWKSATVPATENTVVKTNYTGTGALGGYTVNLTLPVTNLLTVNYYDDYTFVNILTAAEKAKMPFVTVSGYDAKYDNAKGLLTGTRTYQLNDPAKYTVSALYYDYRGRVVQTHTSNHLGGFEDEYFAYTFTGKVKQRQHVHSATGKATQTEVYTYTYDHAERLEKTDYSLNGAAAVTLATYTYDEVGRLKTKKRATETATYNYNVRNWLTQIIGTKFNQTLTYNAVVNSVTPSANLYNGNISATKWKAGNETTERGYKFTYDGLNRLTTATYGEGVSLADNPNRYDELVGYNKMGNIVSLQRKGLIEKKPVLQNSDFKVIDNLTYAYTGNQVTKITDAVTPSPLYAGAFHFMDGANVAVEYTYDANGNLKKDYNKKIVDIQYNSLNLPNGLQFTNGNTTNYIYDAAGQKLSVTHQTAVAGMVIPMTNVMTPLATAQISQTFKTDYCGNVIYENGAVSRILTEGGYITFNGTTPVYHYYLKDHQGNNRVVLNQDGTVEQVNHYYPFGGLMGESTAGGVQPYKYNGKELDRMHGLDLFDYGARHYDAAIGRWWTVDPLAEKYYEMSPYNYCANSPVNFIDPDGRIVRLANNYAGGIENIARIAATSLGSRVMSHLIRQKDVYTLNSTFWTASSSYNPKSRDINYVGNPWYKEIPFDGGALNSMVAMGHETFHAFDHSNYVFNSANAGYSKDIVEPRAVSFGNYLRQAYSLSPLREQYGNIKGNFHQFTGNEEISNFTTLGNNSDKTSYGFSYTKTTTIVESYKTFLGIKTPDKTRTETATYYMTVSRDKNNNVSFQTFSNEEAYKKATSNWSVGYG